MDRPEDDRDRDDTDLEFERTDRFVETDANPEVFRSKSLNELKPFYNGTTLDERMAEIRKSIYHIRLHWDDFDSFMVGLKQLLLEDGSLEFKSDLTREHFETLVTAKRDWLTKEKAQSEQLGYEAVKLYTSKEGHDRIYKIGNNVFRNEGLVSTETIRSLVFLVELINIDLFNYCQKCPEQMNYQGEVYRGICLSDEDMLAFKRLRDEPISRRNIAVPLGLFSSSSSLSVAKRFIEQQVKKSGKSSTPKHPLIIKIHVIALKPEYVSHYKTRFPKAELTTICAVDIQKLSRHKNEKEVLLRGPFMLVLDFYEDERIRVNGEACSVLEAVMLNANRDHISTSFLGDLDTLARDLFASMVTVTRSEFAMEYCRRKGLTDDEQEYSRIIIEHKAKLERLMKE